MPLARPPTSVIVPHCVGKLQYYWCPPDDCYYPVEYKPYGLCCFEDESEEEVAASFGADPRQYAVTTKRFIGDEQGNLKGVVIANVRRVGGSNGSAKLEEVPGSERTLPAELVLLAMGFLGPERDGMLKDLGVALDNRGNVKVDENKATSIPGVFAAGDMSRGQSLIVWAIAEGREAARGVDKYLMGSTVLV